MAMSKDRVRFQLGPCISYEVAKLVKDTLGVDAPSFYTLDPVTIICRPSQFARFLIERNNRGMANGFKELRPELFVPVVEKKPLILDASGN